MAKVPTARGDSIDTGELGFTLPVEMVFLVSCTDANVNWPDLSFDAVPEEERIDDAVAKLEVAKAHGVDSIIDRTLPGIGRDVRRVKKVAERVDVNIIVCTGWYTWHDLPFFFAFSEDDKWREHVENPRPKLEDIFVRDIEVGVGDTGVRAGVIKCVTDHYGLTEGVTRAIRAGARAHRRTGVPVATHTGINLGLGSAVLQQQVFEEEGVDLSRVQFGHIDFTPPEVPLDDFKRLLDKGPFISFDTIATGILPAEYSAARVSRIVSLCADGYADQIMLSSDSACWQDLFADNKLPMESQHDFPPYTHVHLDLLPKLRAAGLSDAQIDQMTIHNPRRFFETRARGAY